MAYLEYSYEHAIIMLYKAFENFNLRVIISCLNHDHSHVEQQFGINLGSHINDDVCEFLVTKGGFFDFKGRDGLIRIYRDLISGSHVVSKILKKDVYRKTINQLCAIRNYSAHNSKKSKETAKKEFEVTRISNAGKCLKQNKRFENIMAGLIALANDIKANA